MTLNDKFISIILTGFLSAMIITSCGSRGQKPDDAFDRVKKVRMLSNDSSFTSDEVLKESMKREPVKNAEYQDEWTKYKNEMEKKIQLNEKTIKEIRGLTDANTDLLKKLTNLEKANNDLRIKIAEYNEEVKVKWEKFKASLNQNVNEIDIELNALKNSQ
jgi:chromosome segregation ATPase